MCDTVSPCRSGGRAELGIGAAWYELKHRFFGIPFPPLGERFDRLGELRAVGADTVYFHLYDVTDLDHVRLLGREVLTQLT
jgi:hypothetical protein